MSNSEVEKGKGNYIKEGNQTREEHKRDESDEDVPGDFFDDFLKEDFMAGLDIVDDDEWDEAKLKLGNETVKNTTKDVKTPATDSSKIDSSKKRKKVESSVTKIPAEEKSRSKQKKKKHDVQESNNKHKRSVEADEFDIRRDPEKTKRDIARDKVRCEKDKEMKIISEKLNLVETGLVPPGMEMETDIEAIKKQKESIERKSPRDLREVIKDIKGRNKTPTPRAKSPLKTKGEERSPLRRRRSSLSGRKHSRSPRREPLKPRRVISPRRSPLRRISPRRNVRRILPKRRSLERPYVRKSRSRSPLFKNQRIKYSPYRPRNRSSSRESDREKWLKHRHSSRSPRRKRDAKKSFLQEIAEKLNELRQPVNIMPPLQQMQPMLQPMPPTLTYVQPIPVPPPAPVPPPSNQSFDPYDQSFFIGNSQPALLNDFSNQTRPSPLPMTLNPNELPNLSKLSSNFTSNMGRTLVNLSTSKDQTKQVPKTQEDITKLFQDKQITLSEFLAITAKPEVLSASPKHLQEKVKVISRCHEAIKILTSCEKKYSGKLTVYKGIAIKPPPRKNISPLKSAPPVLLPFTHPLDPAGQQKRSFTSFINELLQKLGLLNETVIDIDEDPSIADNTGEIRPIKIPVPPPPLVKPFNNYVPEITQTRYNYQDNRLCKMVQTDVFKCESCEKRKKILYHSTAMQTIEPSITFSVSTQVTEEDFHPKFPKTQSLAALTPAQLLAKSRESLNAATRSTRIDIDSFDPTNYNRSIFGMPRSNLPTFPSTSMSLYDTLSSHMPGGGGGRQRPFAPRTNDPNVRFTYNKYY